MTMHTKQRETQPCCPGVQPASTGLIFEWEEIREALLTALGIVRPTVTGVLALFVVGFGYFYFLQDMRFFLITSGSMAPTIQQGDYVMTVAARAYRRGDVIIFEDPVHPGEFMTKRIVGIGGDTVEMRQGQLRVNGQGITEPYVPEMIDYRMGELVVPVGEVFVLGDNRNESEDGHLWRHGVPVANIRGRVVCVYLPWPRVQRVMPEHARFAME